MLYVEIKFTVGERRVLSTKRATEGWDRVKKQPDIVKHSLKKCGLSKYVDGSENDLVVIKDNEGYKMPLTENEFLLLEEERLYRH